MEVVDYAEVIAEHGMFCHICWLVIVDESDLHFDHVIPLALGGKDRDEDMEPLCLHHHATKTKRDLAPIAKAKRRGLKHRGEFPASKHKLKGRGFQRRWEG